MNKYNGMNKYNQHGFTLIELMISLVLGLLISAAVIQVFITAQRVDRVQTGGSQIQDAAIFGVQSIENHVRIAGMGNSGKPSDHRTNKGAIVLTSSGSGQAFNVVVTNGGGAANSPNLVTAGGIKSAFLTKSDGISNTDTPSEQLVIQYINEIDASLFDCEGIEVLEDEHVIERYFLAEETTSSYARKDLSLKCDAGRIVGDQLANFGDVGSGSGAVMIRGVDQFNVRLGTTDNVAGNGANMIYEQTDMSIDDYTATTFIDKPSITNIRLGLLMRSEARTSEGSSEEFDILGQQQTLKAQTPAPKLMRRVYESNILLRNSRLMRINQ